MTSAAMPVVPGALAGWVDQSRLASRPAAMITARAAMHAAVRSAQWKPASARRRIGIAVPSLDCLRRHPIRMTAGSMAAVTVLVVTMGWNAGPGSPLHPVQLVREDASLVLASPNHAVDLRLDYAEARLRDAAAGSDPRDNLSEAAALLGAARQDLPANRTDPLWLRWSHDEGVLGTLLGATASPAPSADSSGSGRGHDGLRSQDGSGGREGGGRKTDGGGGAAPGVGAPAPPVDDRSGGGGSSGDGGSGSGKQPVPLASTPPVDGGGGGPSGKDGGSSTPDPSPSGGGGRDGN